MNFSENVDEIVAFIMAVAGVAVLVGGSYAIFCMMCEVAVEELLLISSALLLPSTGYLFGKSTPKRQDNDVKDILLQSIQKPR
jgi:hypothetical protein